MGGISDLHRILKLDNLFIMGYMKKNKIFISPMQLQRMKGFGDNFGFNG